VPILQGGTRKSDRLLVDPDQQTLEVYRLLEGHWLLEQTAQQADEVNAPPFAEHRFSLADLWVPSVAPDP
jgi:Uma2 family endonuclease